MNLVLFSKGSSFSALERLKTIENAWSYFLRYPVLGVGWGSVTSHDLVVRLLASIGILGFASFALMIFMIGLGLERDIRGRRDAIAQTQMVWLVSFTMLVFVDSISGFSYVLGHWWFILAIAISCTTLRDEKKHFRSGSFIMTKTQA